MEDQNNITEKSTSNNITEFEKWRDENKKNVKDLCEEIEGNAI
jgi:hypothetical protein